MKKLIALVLAICSIALFAACSITKCEFCSKAKECTEIDVQGDKALICEECLDKYGAEIDGLNK